MTVAWQPHPGAGLTVDSLLIGASDAILSIRELVRQVAPTNASVLITGPSGSGKEMVARAIHVESRRTAGDLVAVNCGAIPSELLESELFGHERGSFTGAVTQMRGRFEDANGGSLFLDEIGDMPANMQVKLLRVIEERAITRIGGRTPIPIDTRIISATHRNIEAAIDNDSFREDLFYRLAVFPIHLPALNERPEDIAPLIAHFVALSTERRRPLTLSHGAMMRLQAYRWPGNVRELRNFVERASIVFPGKELSADEVDMLLTRGQPRRRVVERDKARVPEPAEEPTLMQGELPLAPATIGPGRPVDLKSLVAEFEYRHIVEALQASRGVVADAARLLSLQRTTLIEKMQKYGVSRVTS